MVLKFAQIIKSKFHNISKKVYEIEQKRHKN